MHVLVLPGRRVSHGPVGTSSSTSTPAHLSLSIFSAHCQTLSQQFDVVYEKYPEAPGAAEAIDVPSRLLQAGKSHQAACDQLQCRRKISFKSASLPKQASQLMGGKHDISWNRWSSTVDYFTGLINHSYWSRLQLCNDAASTTTTITATQRLHMLQISGKKRDTYSP